MNKKEYFAHPAISKSDLDLIAKSPKKFKNKNLHRKETAAMLLGSVVHKLVLEPNEFEDEFCVVEKIDKRSKSGKEEYKRLTEENADKVLLDRDVFDQAQEMAKSVLEHEFTRIILTSGKAEQSIFSELSGVQVKCRPDYYIKDFMYYKDNGDLEICDVFIDIKTIDEASERGFRKSAKEWNYDVQAAYYLDVARSKGLNVRRFIFICVEKKDDYDINMFDFKEEEIEVGRKKYLELLEKYKNCLENNKWHGYIDFDSGKIITTVGNLRYNYN